MLNRRLFVLLMKEATELLRNRRLVIFLTIAPVLSMVIFGSVLNSNISHLRLGILDQNQVALSRELVDAFTANQVFLAKGYTNDQQKLTQQIEHGQVDAGLPIPSSFSRDLSFVGSRAVCIT